MPPKLHTYTVVPSLPDRLLPLHELAYNLRWAWDNRSRQLFRAIDDDLWESSGHNPAKMLGLVAQERLTALATDAGFLQQLDGVYAEFRAYIDGETWWSKKYGTELVEGPSRKAGSEFKIAYFSAEFGITECLPIYSGGLGVLAGDHLKSASDLGLPLAAVGFLYQRGYFRQTLNPDGWQVENYPTTDFYTLPIEPVCGADDLPVTISVDFPGRSVHVQVWKAQVGRIPLYLLDTNLPQNNESDRHIAGNLYGGDNETRIQQEIVLGIGGVHALAAMGITPTVCHMNEGHSAFMALERIRRLIQEEGLTFVEASEAAAAGNLFTTHTPVPAGFDLFPEDLMRHYFSNLRRHARPVVRRSHGPRPRQPGRQGREVQHGGSRVPPCSLYQRRQQAARQGLARDGFAVCALDSRSTKCRSAASPTAFTQRPSCHARWPSCWKVRLAR